MGIFDGIIGSVLGLAGSAFAADQSVKGQQQANETNLEIAQANNQFNAQQAELNRTFQEQMANTTWQRGVADITAAGLNPMLAYSQGGNPSPSGSTASAAPVAPMQNTRAIGAEIGMRGLQTAAQVANLGADTELKKATEVKEIASAGHLDATRRNIEQEMTAFPQRLANLMSEGKLIDTQQAHTEEDRQRLVQEKLKIMLQREEEIPAAIKAALAQASKYTQEARLFGLKVPEAIREAAFFGDQATGPRAVAVRHAGGIAPNIITTGSKAINSATSINAPNNQGQPDYGFR